MKIHGKSFNKCLHTFPTGCCNQKVRFLFGALIAACLIGQCSSAVSQAPHECESLDIRDDCSNFKKLEKCTVVKGYLMIVLMPSENNFTNRTDTCNWNEIKFPLLREITDYLILYQVKGLRSIRDMFPNLTVIRGRRLFLNYALGITEMPDLEALEFKSLVAIQRGNVFIASSPKLCQLENIYWARLVLSQGTNYIYQVAQDACKTKAICKDCPSTYCWSNIICQKFENDNVFNALPGIALCDEECLGGCNKTSTDCAVCRRFTDHGKCVRKCPPSKLKHEHFQRCYTYEECINEMGFLRHMNACVSHCPSGYKPNKQKLCTRCRQGEECKKFCNPEQSTEEFYTIYSLDDVDRISGCAVINSSLVITLRDKIPENDLITKFSSLREIRGHLKVFRSSHLTSLKFLSEIEKIEGYPSDSDTYSVVIYGNNNLEELWKPKPNLELEVGSMYIDANDKLCNHYILQFSNLVKHDSDKDFIQKSDQDVLCGAKKLSLHVEVLSHRALRLSWPKEQTYDEIEIMYRPISAFKEFKDNSELDTPVCERINWRRELISIEYMNSVVRYDETHFSYIIDGLEQNTIYACLLKTFGPSYIHTSRSEIVSKTTKLNIPPPPKIKMLWKTNMSLTFRLDEINGTNWNYKINHYEVEVFEIPDNVTYLDKRNFCQNPAYLTTDVLTEAYCSSVYKDYDDCCARLENSLEDERFMAAIDAEFSCSLDRKKRCINENVAKVTDKPIRALIFPYRGLTPYRTVDNLKPFHLYVLMARACNEVGCGSFSMHNERTNYTSKADTVVSLNGCHVPDSTEYRIHFIEPINPNGAIVSYVVHLRNPIPEANDYNTHIGCVTRLEHVKAGNLFVRHINSTYNQVAVRAYSLAGDTVTDWLPITLCGDSSTAAPTELPDSNNEKANETSERSFTVIVIGLVVVAVVIVAGGIWLSYKAGYCDFYNFLRQLLIPSPDEERLPLQSVPVGMDQLHVAADKMEQEENESVV